MTHIVSRASLEMIKFVQENGCPWSISTYAEYYHLLSPLKKNYCYQKLKYLVDNGCPFDDEDSKRVSIILESCCKLRDLSALECLVGKYSRFDNALLKEILSNYKSHHTYGPYKDKPWIEGIKFVFEKGKEINSYKSIESVLDILPNMELVKYLRECLKLPWTCKDRNEYILLSRIAHYHGIDGVKWALDNSFGHDNHSSTYFNQLPDSAIDVCSQIIKRDFIFSSSLEKREVVENAFKESCKHPNDENRNSLALLHKIPVLQLNSSSGLKAEKLLVKKKKKRQR